MSVVRLNRVACLAARGIELERRLAEVVAATRADPDCESYVWLRSEAPGPHVSYWNLSRWRTRDRWERHLASNGFATFMAAERADPCLLGSPEHHDLTEIGAAA